MRHQTRTLLGKAGQKLLQAKWNLIVMAAFCFCMAAFNFVTAPQGGTGMFLITPTEGPAGTVPLIPWCAIAVGALSLVGSFVSRSAWVLSWTEVVAEALILLFGLGELVFPTLGAYAEAWSFVGVVLAVLIALVAADMERKRVGSWVVELVVAAAVGVLALANALNAGGLGAAQGLTSLTLFVAAWGFVCGATALQGVGSVEDSIVAPLAVVRRRYRKEADAA